LKTGKIYFIFSKVLKETVESSVSPFSWVFHRPADSNAEKAVVDGWNFYNLSTQQSSKPKQSGAKRTITTV